jgi:hypothetical protein
VCLVDDSWCFREHTSPGLWQGGRAAQTIRAAVERELKRREPPPPAKSQPRSPLGCLPEPLGGP